MAQTEFPQMVFLFPICICIDRFSTKDNSELNNNSTWITHILIFLVCGKLLQFFFKEIRYQFWMDIVISIRVGHRDQTHKAIGSWVRVYLCISDKFSRRIRYKSIMTFLGHIGGKFFFNFFYGTRLTEKDKELIWPWMD